jgi:hypothetical protein
MKPSFDPAEAQQKRRKGALRKGFAQDAAKFGQSNNFRC